MKKGEFHHECANKKSEGLRSEYRTTTDFHNWNGLSPNLQFVLNIGSAVFAFLYASECGSLSSQQKSFCNRTTQPCADT